MQPPPHPPPGVLGTHHTGIMPQRFVELASASFYLLVPEVGLHAAFTEPSYLIALPPNPLNVIAMELKASVNEAVTKERESIQQLRTEGKESKQQKKNHRKRSNRRKKAAKQKRQPDPFQHTGEEEEEEGVDKQAASEASETALQKELAETQQKLAHLLQANSVESHIDVWRLLDRCKGAPTDANFEALALGLQVANLQIKLELREREIELQRRDLQSLKFRTAAGFCRKVMADLQQSFLKQHEQANEDENNIFCDWPSKEELHEGCLLFSSYTSHQANCHHQIQSPRPLLGPTWKKLGEQIHQMKADSIPIPYGAGVDVAFMAQLCREQGLSFEEIHV
ncbi:hypothetical protein QOT17_020732 [Balamuthia mandrillaris]